MTVPGRDVSRHTWDVAAFEKRAQERERAERDAEMEQLRARKAARSQDRIEDDPFAPTRAWLRKRDHKVDFESKVGTAEIVGSIQGGGFVCKVCNVTLKDSNRYLKHVNSRHHQKALGMSMRVKRSTVEEIRDAFEEAVRRRDARKKRVAEGPLSLAERIASRKAMSKKP